MKPSDPLLLADGNLRCGMYPAGKDAFSQHLAIPEFSQSDHTVSKLSADAGSLWNTVKQASRPQVILKTQPPICLDYRARNRPQLYIHMTSYMHRPIYALVLLQKLCKLSSSQKGAMLTHSIRISLHSYAKHSQFEISQIYILELQGVPTLVCMLWTPRVTWILNSGSTNWAFWGPE